MNRQPKNFLRWGILPCSVLTAMFLAAPAPGQTTITDGFGDADRNNDGAISLYDTDQDLNESIDETEVSSATDPADTGLIWSATRGFTSNNTGDPKVNAKVIDDSAGIGSGLALAAEGKGSGSSMVGFFGENVALGPNPGDLVMASFDFRIDTESNNPTPPPASGELRWGLFEDTDNQFGMTNEVGLDSGAGQATVTWGPDTGENDGDWRGADPGPVGDKGLWTRIPIGVLADPESTRINVETNSANFLEGSSVSGGGDLDTVALPPFDGPGGKIGGDLDSDPNNLIPTMSHNLKLVISRTDSGDVQVSSFINDQLVLSDLVDPADPDVIELGGPAESFDYVALRNTGANGDWDFVIDNVVISTIPEPSSLALCLLTACGITAIRRRRNF